MIVFGSIPIQASLPGILADPSLAGLIAIIGLSIAILTAFGLPTMYQRMRRPKFTMSPHPLIDLKLNPFPESDDTILPRMDYVVKVKNTGKSTISNLSATAQYRLPSGYLILDSATHEPELKLEHSEWSYIHRLRLALQENGIKSENEGELQPEDDVYLKILTIERKENLLRIIANINDELFPLGLKQNFPLMFSKPLDYVFSYGSKVRNSDLRVDVILTVRGNYRDEEVSDIQRYTIFIPGLGKPTFNLRNGIFGKPKREIWTVPFLRSAKTR